MADHYSVAVVAETDVDEGIARVYADFNDLPYFRYPVPEEITVDHVVLVGRVGNYSDEYEACTVLQGATRVETVRMVIDDLRGGFRDRELPY